LRNLEIDSQTTLAHILNELKNTQEEGLELTSVPGEKTILDNSLNRAIIEKAAAQFKREVVFPALPIDEAPIVESDDLGFVEGEDVLKSLPMEEVPKVVQPISSVAGEGGSTSPTSVVSPKKKFKFVLPKVFKNKLVMVSGVVVFVLGLIVLFLAGLPSAQVTLTLSAQEKETESTLIADPKATEVSDDKIPLVKQEVTKEGSEEATATGKKTIGTPATGRVTIYNRDTVGKQFLKGAIITAVATGSATFKLDADVTLEAPPFGEETKVGVQVTATKAGPESNLPANTTFKVGAESTPLVFAKNDLAFSGGSTKQATVVSAGDRDSLKSKIVENLTKEAESELEEKTADSLIPEGGVKNEVISEAYEPKAVDAEAEKLKATVSLKTTANLLKKQDLEEILIKLAESKADGFKVDLESSQISASVVEEQPDGSIKILAKIKAKLIPDLNEEEIKGKITGKGLNEVENYLESLDHVSGYKVNTSPAPFRLLKLMPFFKDKIKINVETE
jgi:hypothetical protein